jgi:hypothetical protein
LEFKNDKGSALLTFLFFFPIIVGCIIFSLYVGERSKDQVRVSQLSQLSSDALASHSSQGLNMIAVNNQAIAASLQVHNSTLIISYYGGLVRAMLYGIDDAIKDAVKNLASSVTEFSKFPGIGSQIQEDIFDLFNNYAAFFINNASGLTLYNQKLSRFWNYGALSSGTFVTTSNSPTAIALPLQGDQEEGGFIPYTGFGYKYLETSTTEDAICTTMATPIKEKGYLQLEDLLNFLTGPVTKLTGSTAIMSTINNLVGTIGNLSPIQFTNTECGVALRSPLKNLFNLKGIIGNNTLKNILSKALIISEIKKYFEEFLSFHPSGSHVPPSNLPCDVTKGLTKTALTAMTISDLLTDAKTKNTFEAVSMRKSYEKGVSEIRYSEITPEECNQVDDQPTSRCNKIMHLTSQTHLCPLYYNSPGVIDSFIDTSFFSACSSSRRRGGGLFERIFREEVDRKPRQELRKRMANICHEYIPWAIAAEKNEDNGYRLTNIGTQSNFYLADKHNEKLKYSTNNGQKTHTLGFTYINKLRYSSFLKHQSFKMGVAEPILNLNESLALANGKNKCPLVIEGISEVDGDKISKCRVNVGSLLGYEVTPNVAVSGNSSTTENDDSLTRLMSGGTRELNQESILKRMQWGFAKTRVIFVKGSKDPNPPDFFKTMWPAWSIAPARSKFSDFFAPNSKAYKTVEVFDYLIGK